MSTMPYAAEDTTCNLGTVLGKNEFLGKLTTFYANFFFFFDNMPKVRSLSMKLVRRQMVSKIAFKRKKLCKFILNIRY